MRAPQNPFLIINRVAGMLIGRMSRERGQCGEKMDRLVHFRGHVEWERWLP
jgi:hypothetical protein